MKFLLKNIKLFALILICILVYIIYNNTDNQNISYISLGDGFAEGINCYGKKDYGYSDYLKDYLQKNNKLLNYYNGFTYEDIRISDLYKDILINKKDNNSVNLKQALRNSELLTLSIGLNDLLYQKSINNLSTESKKRVVLNKIEEDFTDLIIEIKKYYKYDIYIIGYYNFYPQNSVERNLLNQLNEIYKRIANDENIKYIKTESIINDNNKYLENPNSFYPNLKGYEKIYEKIKEQITL